MTNIHPCTPPHLTSSHQVRLSKGIFGCDRDFLYQSLVRAFRDDALRVEEAWLEVQEEGLAPSDRLKLDIAKALEAGGREVPFEVPVQYERVAEVEEEEEHFPTPNIEEERKTERKVEKSARSPAPEIQGVKEAPKARVARVRGSAPDQAEAEAILAMLGTSDLASVVERLSTSVEQGSLRQSVDRVLEKLVEKDITEGSRAVAFVQNSLPKLRADDLPNVNQMRVKRLSDGVMKRFAKEDNMSACLAFYSSLEAIEQQKFANQLNVAKRMHMLMHDEQR